MWQSKVDWKSQVTEDVEGSFENYHKILRVRPRILHCKNKVSLNEADFTCWKRMTVEEDGLVHIIYERDTDRISDRRNGRRFLRLGKQMVRFDHSPLQADVWLETEIVRSVSQSFWRHHLKRQARGSSCAYEGGRERTERLESNSKGSHHCARIMRPRLRGGVVRSYRSNWRSYSVMRLIFQNMFIFIIFWTRSQIHWISSLYATFFISTHHVVTINEWFLFHV